MCVNCPQRARSYFSEHPKLLQLQTHVRRCSLPVCESSSHTPKQEEISVFILVKFPFFISAVCAKFRTQACCLLDFHPPWNCGSKRARAETTSKTISCQEMLIGNYFSNLSLFTSSFWCLNVSHNPPWILPCVPSKMCPPLTRDREFARPLKVNTSSIRRIRPVCTVTQPAGTLDSSPSSLALSLPVWYRGWLCKGLRAGKRLMH